MNRHTAHQAVRLTARLSALLFAAAQATSALKPTRRASRPLYLGFLIAHAVHFVAVTRYAVLTGGRNLFPGGRSLADVGGWPTMAGIVAAFYVLAVTGGLARTPDRTWRPAAGRVSTGVIAAMFVSVYLQRLRVLGSEMQVVAKLKARFPPHLASQSADVRGPGG